MLDNPETDEFKFDFLVELLPLRPSIGLLLGVKYRFTTEGLGERSLTLGVVDVTEGLGDRILLDDGIEGINGIDGMVISESVDLLFRILSSNEIKLFLRLLLFEEVDGG